MQQRCGEGTESGDAAMENSSFPSGMEADCCFVSGYCCGISHVDGAGFFFFFEVSHERGVERVQLKPRDTIREMIAKLQGCGGDDIIDT